VACSLLQPSTNADNSNAVLPDLLDLIQDRLPTIALPTGQTKRPCAKPALLQILHGSAGESTLTFCHKCLYGARQPVSPPASRAFRWIDGKSPAVYQSESDFPVPSVLSGITGIGVVIARLSEGINRVKNSIASGSCRLKHNTYRPYACCASA
jgi:hypothetical protein